MRASTRKSSGQPRNRPHIPYRHDDFQHGKRTGMPVDMVERNSDDFEPFDKVISQADHRPAPKVLGRKKRQSLLSTIGDDSNGEMSMELDDADNSPMAYYRNQRISAAPNSIRRVGSSSRPVHHSPEVDYDKLPSPRLAAGSTLSRRQSSTNGNTPGPSRLSQSFVATRNSMDIPHGSDSGDNGGEFDFQPGPPSPSPEHPSFTQLDQEEQEEEQIEDTTLSPLQVANNGRRKSIRKSMGEDERTSRQVRNSRKSGPNGHRSPDKNENEVEERETSKRTNGRNKKDKFEENEDEDEDGHEEAIMQALNDVDNDQEEEEEMEDVSLQKWRRNSDQRPRTLSAIAEEPEAFLGEEEEVEERPVKAKKQRKKRSTDENADAQRPRKKPRTIAGKDRGRTQTPLADMTPEPQIVRLRSVSPENPDGLRRSRRYRYKPLEYWRLEKVVYGRAEATDKPSLVAPIREIIRIPKEEVQPLGGKKYRRPNKTKKKVVNDLEEGWDDETEPGGHVIDFVTKKTVERRIANTANMLELRAVGPYEFQKVFGDGDFIAAGHLVIPVGSEKPSKGAKDNTYVFYVIEGAVNFKIHTTSFIVCTGGSFLVPRGNVYYIQNISSRPVKLFFAQARKVPAGLGESHLLPQRLPSRNSAGDGDRTSNTPAVDSRATTGGPVPLKKGAAMRSQSMHSFA